jgi:PAS domain-containing protein
MNDRDRWPASLDALPDAVLVVGEDGVVVRVNALLAELLGRDPTGDPLAALLDGHVPDAEPGAPWQRRTEVRDHSGVPFLVDVSAGAADGGRRIVVIRKIGVSRLLEESERLLRVAFEIAPIGMAFFSTEGT